MAYLKAQSLLNRSPAQWGREDLGRAPQTLMYICIIMGWVLSSQIYMLKSYPSTTQCFCIWRQGLYKMTKWKGVFRLNPKTVWLDTSTEEGPCENSGKSHPLRGKKKRLQKKPILLTLRFLFLAPRIVRKLIFVFKPLSVCFSVITAWAIEV